MCIRYTLARQALRIIDDVSCERHNYPLIKVNGAQKDLFPAFLYRRKRQNLHLKMRVNWYPWMLMQYISFNTEFSTRPKDTSIPP